MSVLRALEEKATSARLGFVGYHIGMNLSADTQQIVDQLEQTTSKPVHLLPDPALPVHATIKAAKGSAPAHFLPYKPGLPGVDYAIAFQCAFLLRIYQVAIDSRFDFSSEKQGRDSVYKSLSGPNGTLKPYNLPDAAIQTVTDQVFDGLMTQLRSLPIGMRVDAWLREHYPGLDAEQEQSFAAQQAIAAQALSPNVRNMMPPTIFSATAAMNAAYALFCDRLLDRPLYGVAYRSTGFADRGQALLDLWDQLPPDAEHDRALVDAWGNELGLTDWYRWLPWQQSPG